MRCRPGELAFYSGRRPEMLGKVMRVVRLHPMWPFVGLGPAWVTEPPMRWLDGITLCDAVLDASLTPIRDQPGEDETLAWCPVPGKTVEVA